MANPQWPATLPDLVERVGYRETLRSAAIASKMESGRKKRRRRFTTAPKPIDAPIALTLTEMGTFETFWENDLAFGALPFDHKVASTGNNVTFAFRDPEKPPEFTPEAGAKLWRVTLQLEVLP